MKHWMSDKRLILLYIAIFVILTIWIIKPDASMSGVYITDIKESSLNITFYFDKSGLLPIAVDKIYFDIYYVNGPNFEYIGYGEIFGEKLHGDYSWTTIPIQIKDKNVFGTLYRNYTKYESITVKVSGSVLFSSMFSSDKISFDKELNDKKISKSHDSEDTGDSRYGWVPTKTDCRQVGSQIVCKYSYS